MICARISASSSREFWDAGIRGPDFVWAATGPAMEAFSRHPVVKKANEPGTMTVNEFLTHVRRMVVDFVVGRVLSGEKDSGADTAAADRLDEPTAYYLLHRHDFGMDEAPAGACILYAVSCGLSDRELSATWDIIGFARARQRKTRRKNLMSMLDPIPVRRQLRQQSKAQDMGPAQGKVPGLRSSRWKTCAAH